jgi:hypothetical protein
MTFLILQLCSVVYARFIPEKFFCWAPYDEHTNYQIKVNINGKDLSRSEIRSRYNYLSKGWELRSIDNIFHWCNSMKLHMVKLKKLMWKYYITQMVMDGKFGSQ